MQALVLSKERGNRALLTALGSAVTLALIFTIFDSDISSARIFADISSLFGAGATSIVRLPLLFAAPVTALSRSGGWPLFLSGAAFLFSLLTLYLTCLRAPSLQPFLGDLLLMHYTPDGHLQLSPELTIFNNGARVGALVKITGKISHVGGDSESRLHWTSIQEMTNGARPGERNLPYTNFTAHPQAVVVARSEAVSKRVGLISERKLRLLPGTHKLEITLHTGPKGRSRVTVKRTLEISREEERWAYDNRPPEATNTVQNLGLYYNPEKRCFTRFGSPPE
jgi:hypothetical protein